MSTPFDQVLAQFLGQQRPTPVTPNPASNLGLPGGYGNPALQDQPSTEPLPPEDFIVSPNPNQPRTADQRMEGFRRLLTNFTYSLGSGLSAASAGGHGKGLRTAAGIGATLQVPEALRKAQEASEVQRQNQQRLTLGLLLQAKQAAATEANYKSLDESRDALAQSRSDTLAERVKNEGAIAGIRQQVANTEQQNADLKKEIANRPKHISTYKGVGEGGKPIAVNVMLHSDGTLSYELGPQEYEKAPVSKLLTPEEEAQRIRISKASGVNPEQVVQYESPDGPRFGVIDKDTRVIKPVTGELGAMATPKLPEIPSDIKKQGTAAATALTQVDNVETILKANPRLVGPIVGRMTEFMNSVGENPFANTADARLGAQLSEHLNSLFAQELRSLFPGRTNIQMQQLIKSTSARMNQDPNILFGMLDGIKFNEGIVLDEAKKQGWIEERASQISTGKPGAAPAPAAGGASPEGTIIELTKGGQKQIKRGGKWVNYP